MIYHSECDLFKGYKVVSSFRKQSIYRVGLRPELKKVNPEPPQPSLLALSSVANNSKGLNKAMHSDTPCSTNMDIHTVYIYI